MSPLGMVHTGFALLALIAGAGVVLRRKGTRTHKRIGWVYVACMFALNVTALFIYRLTGNFGPFHIAALFSLATVGAGVMAAVRRRPVGHWLDQHYWWMTFSYVGLLAATVAEVVSRVPGTPFWWMVAVSSVAVIGAGAVIVARRAQAAMAPFRGRV